MGGPRRSFKRAGRLDVLTANISPTQLSPYVDVDPPLRHGTLNEQCRASQAHSHSTSVPRQGRHSRSGPPSILVDTNEYVSQREGVRAVGKTEDIIHRLVEKHPRGVPIPEYVLPRVLIRESVSSPNLDLRGADNPSASSAPPREIPHHETTRVMDNPKLCELSRTQLQSLAKVCILAPAPNR